MSSKKRPQFQINNNKNSAKAKSNSVPASVLANKKMICLVSALAVIALAFGIMTAAGVFSGKENGIGTWYATIEVKDLGTIKAELYGDIAPITVQNFVDLANSGFYDGLTFHRIISGFMIQGGDPNGNGTGGSGKNIKGEFSANGVENNLSHTRSVLSMARSSAYDSASSQFFIMHADGTYLDGKYAAFGKVTEGMEIVDTICASTPVQDSNGTVTKADQPIITSIRVSREP